LDSPTEQESEGESIFTLLESEGAASTVVHDQAEHVVLSHDPIAWQPVKRLKEFLRYTVKIFVPRFVDNQNDTPSRGQECSVQS